MLRAELALHTREVRRLHEKLFYRPLLSAVARVPGEHLQLGSKAAGDWLRALGFGDPEGALRHLAALTGGVSRSASMQKLLLPVLLQTFASCPNPDAGLLAYRQVSEALGGNQWYLRLLRDEGQVAERLAQLLGSSQYVAAAAHPHARGAADPGRGRRARAAHAPPRSPSAWRQAAGRAAGPAGRDRRAARAAPARAAAGGLRRPARPAGRRRGRVRRSPTSPSPRCRSGSTSRCARTPRRPGPTPPTLPMDLAVIGMGRLGGGEMGYGSDADVMFVHRPRAGADEAKATAAANAVAHTLRRLLGEPAPDPAFDIDADLRPEGRQGALVRSLSAFREYYERWVSVWEVQALLRAVPVAGDEKLGAEFVELIDPIRYPAEGLTAEQVAEIRRIKARVERERLPRGADPATHTKLGRGGLSDVEWTVAAAAAAARGRRAGAAGAVDRGGADARWARPGCSTPTSWSRCATAWETGHPGAQRDLPGARPAQRPAAPPGHRAGRGGPGLRLRAGPGRRPVRRRLPADHPAGPRRRRPGLLRPADRRLSPAGLRRRSPWRVGPSAVQPGPVRTAVTERCARGRLRPVRRCVVSPALVRSLVAEFLGTALLVLIAVGSAVAGIDSVGAFGVALAFGLTLLALAYAIGPISGCHINPAVTLGVLLSRGMTAAEAGYYWVAQFAGGIAGAAVLELLTSGFGDVTDQTGALGCQRLRRHHQPGRRLRARGAADLRLRRGDPAGHRQVGDAGLRRAGDRPDA